MLVHPVAGAVQVGGGRGADFLGLKLPTQRPVSAPLCGGGWGAGRRARVKAPQEAEADRAATLLGAQFTLRVTVNWFG